MCERWLGEGDEGLRRCSGMSMGIGVCCEEIPGLYLCGLEGEEIWHG